MQRILIIEDDFSLNRTLAYSLQSSNYLVDSAYTLKEAIEYLKNTTYLLLILDVNLPDGSGFKDLYKLKEYSDASIIYLTANDLEKDIIQGYDLGADDYITKPFSLPILQKKIFALTKRLKEKQVETIFDDGVLYINFSTLKTYVNNIEIDISPLEYRILDYLIANKGHILKRNQLLTHLWDCNENFVEDASLNTAISRLRKKIEKNGHRYIKTIYGTGYMWIGDE